ncbi:MAG: hypothetical protein ACSNEK_03190 [Parachlamydiaceae bacterium]
MSISPSTGFNHKLSSFALKGLKKVPYLKNKVSTPKGEATTRKVLHVAIEVFKVLSVIAAGALFGAFVGVGFGGVAPLCISMVAGGLLAGVSYFGAQGVVKVVKKYGYPTTPALTAPAISSDHWLDQKNHKVFHEVLDSLKEEEWFKKWLTLKGYKKADNFLWRTFSNQGFASGESFALLREVCQNKNISSREALAGLPIKTVFRLQILNILYQDLETQKKKRRATAQQEGISFPKLKKSIRRLLLANPHGIRYFCRLNKTVLSNSKTFRRTLKAEKAAILAKQTGREVAGILQVKSKKRTHTLFIQLTDGNYRFYDAYSSRFTGFYAFRNQKALVEGLHRHLMAYVKFPAFKIGKVKRASLHLYAF